MSNCEEVIISVTKGATEIEAKYKWHGRRYVTSNGMVGKVVRCKDCKWACYCETDDMETYIDCDCPDGGGVPQGEEWYCADGERKESEQI